MKSAELRVVRKNRYGKVIINNHNLENHERNTIFRLASFGFDVETIIPSNIPCSNNPDLLLLGTFWEMKGPTSLNKRTITAKFRKSMKQSGGRAIFDLANVKNNDKRVEEFIQELFVKTRGMHRIMIIRKDGETLLDMSK